MGKALKTVGVIIGGAALIATGVGALAMPALAGTSTLFGVSVGTLNTISSGLVAVGGMLDKPKSQGSAAPDEWTSNPDQPIPFLMGRMGVAGKIVQRDEFGPDNMYQGIVGIISGAGPIRGVNGFAGDKQAVTFGANGIAVTSQWEGEMWMVRRAGNQPDTALAVPAGLKSGGAAFEWSPAARLSGKACYLQVLGENSKGTAYPAGIPDPVHDAEGIFGYDPRYDDTYPGGAGPCRLGVRSTYRWINDGGIGALNWALGLVENGQVVGGIGASIDGIDVPAFVEVANIADANGWTLSAWPDTSEDASAVLDQLLQAAGAVRARHAGKISCVSRGAPRASVVTITARDTAGDIELDTAPSLFNRLNTITPRFMSEAAGWVMTPANPVSFPQYVTDDGGKHGDQIDYRFVSSLKQAAELAAYDILDAREPFSGTIPLKAHMRHLKRGDTFDIDEPGFLMDGVKCIVLSRSYDPKTAQVRLGFRSETDSKHPLALGKTTTLPTFPVLTPTDPTFVTPPLPGDWVITPRPPSGDGTQQPGFDLTGLVSNATATAVIVEWGPTADGPWTQAYAGPPDVTSIPIVGLQSGATYFIAVRYQRNSNFSDRYVYGPFVAPTLTSGVSDETIETIISDVLDQVDTDIGEGIQVGRDALVRARDNALLILQNAKNALEGTLKEEEGRKTQTDDLQDRIDIGFLIDPIAKTGIIRSQVKVEGLNETLVQINTRLVARDAANALQTAQVALDAQAYTNDKVSVATANLVTAAQMNTAISGAVLSMRSYADDKVATATAGLVAVAQMNAAIATSALSLQSYTDGKVSEATAGLATSASVAAAIASSDLALRSYTDGQISTATANLISAAGVDSKIATASLALSSQTDSKIATATANLISAAQLATALAGSELSLKGYTDGQISTATALLASKAEVFANQNLMPNGSGELGLTGWAGPVGLETIFWQPYGGQILKQPIPGPASDWYIIGPQAKVSGQGTVTLSWRGGREGDYAGTATVFLVFRDALGATVGETPRKDIGTLDPGKFVTAPVPAGAATAQLGIHINGAGGLGQSVWISRVKIENGAVVTPYTLDGTAFSLAATAAIQADAIADAATKLSQARLRLITAAEDGQPATVELFSDSEGTSYVRLGAKQIGFGGNTEFEDETDTLVTTIGSVRYITAWGAPFGPDSLMSWKGPANVGAAGATKALAESIGGAWEDSTGDSFFGGRTLDGPFDSGAPSGAATSPPKNAWTTVASVDRSLRQSGYIMSRVFFDVLLGQADSDGNLSVEYRVAVTDQDGGNLSVVAGNFGAFPPNSWTSVGGLQGVALEGAFNLAARGRKKIVLQVNPTGSSIGSFQVRNGRLRGLNG